MKQCISNNLTRRFVCCNTHFQKYPLFFEQLFKYKRNSERSVNFLMKLRWPKNKSLFIIHLKIPQFTYPITGDVLTANHITNLPTATLSIDQSNRSPGFLNFQLTKIDLLTLKIASAQVAETSVANNSPSRDSSHPDDNFQPS